MGWDMTGAGEKGCAPRLGPCTIKVALDGSSSSEERQLLPLLLPPTALSRQKESKQRQALRMKFQALKVAALLLVLLCSAPTPSETLRGWASTSERQSGAGGPGEDPWPPGDGRDNLPGQSSKGSHHSPGAWKVMDEAPTSKAVAKPLLSRDEQKPLGKPRRRPLHPFHSRSMGLRHHLKGYGKFNEDTHSCHNIQSRPCQKPSDCGGCLGLYTCKLPAGTCDLKAVSRQRGGFFQSIQHPEGRRILLIP